ncbi:YceI family protein [Flavobacterium sp. XS1P32]|uniref:YceI family protein n=1 Tax=Flavobacterium sp. XS1P32 TaxID=3401726 RepID=UPI003AAB5B1F
MKKITIALLLLFAMQLLAQERMMTDRANVSFEASIPFFEEVKAINKKASCVLITKTGDFTCWMYVKDFQFERSLMQEHFNDNYLESNEYPRAIFKGRIEKFDLKNCTSTAKQHQINGKITIHGKTKKINCVGFLKKIDNRLELVTSVIVNTADFNIKIPAIVDTKISKTVKITVSCVLQ